MIYLHIAVVAAIWLLLAVLVAAGFSALKRGTGDRWKDEL